MSTTTPENCPKCGCEMTVECDGRPMHVGRNWRQDDYSFCLERQLKQTAKRVKDFEEQLAFAHAALENAERRDN